MKNKNNIIINIFKYNLNLIKINSILKKINNN